MAFIPTFNDLAKIFTIGSDDKASGSMVIKKAGEIQLVENTGTYLYEGFAPFGTATSLAKWHIIRTTLSGSNIIAVERSGGDGVYGYEWDERAGTVTYS